MTCYVRPPGSRCRSRCAGRWSARRRRSCWGWARTPAEVATQLARSAERGDKDAISALREAAQSVGSSDASDAADLSKRALELLPADDAERGSLVAETGELLNRA